MLIIHCREKSPKSVVTQLHVFFLRKLLFDTLYFFKNKQLLSLKKMGKMLVQLCKICHKISFDFDV